MIAAISPKLFLLVYALILVSQKTFSETRVGVRQQLGAAQVTLLLGAFIAKVMAGEGLPVFVATCCLSLNPLCRTTVGLYLRHNNLTTLFLTLVYIHPARDHLYLRMHSCMLLVGLSSAQSLYFTTFFAAKTRLGRENRCLENLPHKIYKSSKHAKKRYTDCYVQAI